MPRALVYKNRARGKRLAHRRRHVVGVGGFVAPDWTNVGCAPLGGTGADCIVSRDAGRFTNTACHVHGDFNIHRSTLLHRGHDVQNMAFSQKLFSQESEEILRHTGNACFKADYVLSPCAIAKICGLAHVNSLLISAFISVEWNFFFWCVCICLNLPVNPRVLTWIAAQ